MRSARLVGDEYGRSGKIEVEVVQMFLPKRICEDMCSNVDDRSDERKATQNAFEVDFVTSSSFINGSNARHCLTETGLCCEKGWVWDIFL